MPKIKDILVKIEEVFPVAGSILHPDWRSPMQKITTDPPAAGLKETFYIDNEPGRSFGNGPVGFDWKTKKGTTVKAKVIQSKGYEWLHPSEEPIKPTDNLLTTSKLAIELGITKKELDQRLVAAGHLEKQEDKLVLTLQGKAASGQSRENEHGPYFMWPADLKI